MIRRMEEEREEKGRRLRILQIDKRVRDGTYLNASTLAKVFCVTSTALRP
jgi:hypothetical protein